MAASRAEATEGRAPHGALSWLALTVFFIAATLAYTDRLILNVLVEPIRHDLGASDLQVSFLQGAAFAVIYSLIGLPLGRVADRRNRRDLVVAGIILWSLATAACGFAANVGQLFVARVFVGIGEAALAPAVMSMIPDLFPPAKRGTAIGVFLAGMTMGGGVSVAVGGLLLGALSSGAFARLPLLGQLAPWRAVLVCLSLPGFAVALLTACLPEPPRRERAQTLLDAALGPVLTFFARHGALFAAMFGAFALMQVADYGFSAWLPSLFLRRFAVVPAVAGPRIGLVSIVFGGAGTLLGGWLADRLLARGVADGRIRVALFAYALTLPCLLFPLLASGRLVLFGYAAYSVISAVATSAGLTATQDAVRAEMRGLSVSFQAMAYTLFGLGCGPTLVAAATEHVYRNPSRVGNAMVTVAAPAGITAVLLLAAALRPYRAIRKELGSI